MQLWKGRKPMTTKNLHVPIRNLIGALCMALISTGAVASQPEFPQSVPPACTALAERHGVPSLIENKAQARSAEAKLNALSVSEEGVHECRTAVTRIKAQYRAHLRERAIQSVKGWVQEWRRVE
jgi:hypothetical protein